VVVNVLGHFDVWHGTRDLTPPRGYPAALVQLLAIHDGVVHRDRLTAALWPDDAPWVGQQRLRNVLARVRAHTGGLVAREPRRDLLVFAQPVRIDVAEFLAASGEAIRLAREDPPAALELGVRALLLHRGPLLADHVYADWAQPRRVYVAERYRLLLEALAQAAAVTGDQWTARLYRQRASTADATSDHAD
jgi:DNA-binding SARP family transcriptional activator